MHAWCQARYTVAGYLAAVGATSIQKICREARDRDTQRNELFERFCGLTVLQERAGEVPARLPLVRSLHGGVPCR
ncbi:MAG: hypothetical protein HYX75_23150 [Acidobacteria bacterium]|nr:hypothetical protein [Acidobacteriota bacterium]